MFFTDEMPKNCRECPCVDGEYGVCNIDCSVDLSADYRPKECPLQEVEHGTWKFVNGFITCSMCGCQPYKHSTHISFDNLWKICPNCGARMDREGE